MKKLLFALIILAVTQVSAQPNRDSKAAKRQAKQDRINEMIRQAEEGVLVFEKQNSFGVQLRSSGYGAFYEKGYMKTNRKANLFSIDISEIKSPHEEKTLGGSWIFGNPYIFSKINYFYPIDLGFGQQYLLGNKGNKNGVAVSLIYKGGISVGLVRPYAIDINENGEQKSIRYSAADSLLFVTGNVLGGSGLFKGWQGLSVEPGVFAKAALRFDYGRFNDAVNAIEIGFSANAYASKIPILLYRDPKQFFFQGHVAIVFGKRK